MKEQNAYLTVYLALCLPLILSLYLVLIDGARRNGAALEAICVTEAGMQSIMAEYHRELLEQYNLFAIDSSYGTNKCGRKNTESHLLYYLRKNLSLEDVFLSDYLYRDFLGLQADDAELTNVSFLTDEKGAVFRKQAVEAIRDDVGLGLLENLGEWMRTVEINGLDVTDIEEQKQNLDRQLEEFNGREIAVSDTESVLVEVENPTAQLEAKRGMGILSLVVEDGKELSVNTIDSSKLVKSRIEEDNVNLGGMETDEAKSLWDRFLFQEYLLRYMGNYGREDDTGALRYQIEYLIAGKDCDKDNLKSVANRICIMRQSANAAYLLSSQQKRAEIKAAASIACGLLLLPELMPVMESLILFGWAYAESIYDVKTLLAGGNIPLLKDDSSWHCSLAAALGG